MSYYLKNNTELLKDRWSIRNSSISSKWLKDVNQGHRRNVWY